MPFPSLPVLEDLVAHAKGNHGGWRDVTIVAVQHLLESTGSLVAAALRLGVPASRVHLLGKQYSTSEEVVRELTSELGVNVHQSTTDHTLGRFGESFAGDVARMWKVVAENLEFERRTLVVVLDDGGRCIESIPAAVLKAMDVIGIEQTTSGVYTQFESVPIIEVATSAAKRIIEPPLIANATLEKIRNYLPDRVPRRCGVIGLGNIGTAVARALLELGHTVFGTDMHKQKHSSIAGIRWCGRAEDVIDSAEIIFGCTGRDCIESPEALSEIRGLKTLLSVSSEDVEFRSLLHHASTQRLVTTQGSDVDVTFPKGTIRIVKYGFPVNFDGSRWSVASDIIQLTRGLLLGALIQAVQCQKECLSMGGRRLMLSPELQQFVVSRWSRSGSVGGHWPISEFSDVGAITANSGGERLEGPALPRA